MESPPKKHKKHKKHKHHKKRRDGEEEDSSIMVVGAMDQSMEPDMVDVTGGSPPPAIKLKIKIGAKSAPTTGSKVKVLTTTTAATPLKSPPPKTATLTLPDGQSPPPDTPPSTVHEGAADTSAAKKSGEDTSDEEREWLNALESGTLDDNGEVKKAVDESLLTTRQKALLHGNNEDLLELPSGYKTAELTELQLQQRLQRAKKRREQAQEKREKDKKSTLDRLLKKQDSKFKTGRSKGTRRTATPSLRYINTASSVTISVPYNLTFPLASQVTPKLPVPTMCGVSGCNRHKKYSCSKTGIPLCSLQCYKQNLESHNMHPIKV